MPITALLLLCFCLAACDGGADITLPPESSSDTPGTLQKDEYSFIYNNTSVTPHARMSELLNGLGDPTAYEESNSCYYQGLDKDYTYPGFKLRTYPSEGVDYVLNICFTDDSVTTAEGIMLGSTRDQVLKAYGSAYSEENGNIVYTLGRTSLRIRFSDDCVSAIEYWAVED